MLAACSQGPEASPSGERIACALDGVVEFASSCTVERDRDGVTVHRPDGGFRRFAVDGDGILTVADGAETSEAIPLADGSIELQVEDDRYRLRLDVSDAPSP